MAAQAAPHTQFAVVVDDRPVGLIGAQRESAESVYLYSLWLEPAARGRGLARTAGAAVDWARRQRVRTVTLRVHGQRRRAQVYERLGFGVATDGRGRRRR